MIRFDPLILELLHRYENTYDSSLPHSGLFPENFLLFLMNQTGECESIENFLNYFSLMIEDYQSFLEKSLPFYASNHFLTHPARKEEFLSRCFREARLLKNEIITTKHLFLAAIHEEMSPTQNFFIDHHILLTQTRKTIKESFFPSQSTLLVTF